MSRGKVGDCPCTVVCRVVTCNFSETALRKKNKCTLKQTHDMSE